MIDDYEVYRRSVA